MLNPDHPQSAHVYAASWQIELILDCCKRITLLGRTPARRAFVEIMRPAFAALRWLNRERFGHSRRIDKIVDRLEREAEALADLPVAYPPPHTAAPTRCPTCGGAMTTHPEEP